MRRIGNFSRDRRKYLGILRLIVDRHFAADFCKRLFSGDVINV